MLPDGMAWRCSGAFPMDRYRKDGIFVEATCQNQKIRAEFLSSTVWGSSSAGRALRSQCRGREFDPPLLHHDRIPSASSRRSDACFHRRFSYLQVLSRLHEARLRASLLRSICRLPTDSREQNPRSSCPSLPFFVVSAGLHVFSCVGIHCLCTAGLLFF